MKVGPNQRVDRTKASPQLRTASGRDATPGNMDGAGSVARIRNAMVTGGAGFIGSHLLLHLSGSAEKVRAIDSLRYGAWTNVIARLAPDSLIHADIVDLTLDDMARQLEGCDVLFHFAAEKHNNAIDDPQRVIDTNISATARLFSAAGIAGVRKVVFASSLYAYGRLGDEPMRETATPAPATVYGVSKLAGEGLLREAGNRYGFDHVSLRLFFVYGPRQFAGMGYPSVIVRNFNRILKGEPPVIFGDGLQALDYIFVDDTIRAIDAAVEKPVSGQTINIGSGLATSVKSLTDAMLRVAGSNLTPVYGPPDWTAGTVRVSDPTKAWNLLGFKAEIDLEKGLEHVWSWLKEMAK